MVRIGLWSHDGGFSADIGGRIKSVRSFLPGLKDGNLSPEAGRSSRPRLFGNTTREGPGAAAIWGLSAHEPYRASAEFAGGYMVTVSEALLRAKIPTGTRMVRSAG
jgi:hypothetical protein